VTVKVSTGEVTTIGPTRLYTATSASPDGRYLLVSWLDRPYSYSLPCGRFPKKVHLWMRCVGCVLTAVAGRGAPWGREGGVGGKARLCGQLPTCHSRGP